MKITQKLRDHMIQHHGVAADASDEVVKSAVVESLMSEGGLSTKQLDELTSEVDPKAKLSALVSEEVTKAMTPIISEIKGMLTSKATPAKEEDPEKPLKKLAPLPDGTTVEKVFAKAGQGMTIDGEPEVLEATHHYDGTKSGLVWQKDRDMHYGNGAYAPGKPAFIWENDTGVESGGHPKYLNELSAKERAKANAVLKWKLIHQCPSVRDRVRMTEHDMALLKESLHKDRWVGALHKEQHYLGSRMLKDFDVKAVLDDATSGGQESVPEYFDYDAIRTPLLSGELFPYVQVVPVARGSAADSYSIGTPTFVSTASGSAITPFSTTGFVGAFDTTFFPASCGFELGLDFESDADPNFMSHVMAQIGEESKRWLDEQIAIGDGTTEPQGIFVASGTAVTATSSHTFSSLVFADIVKLAFGITKPHREAFGGTFTRFVMNDPQYRVLMSIATGVTGDTRPIFGMGWRDYVLGDYPVSVQNNISNGNLGLCNLRGYRMYRRAGLRFQEETGGSTLILANKKLLFARMRWGGQLTLPSGYMAEMTT